MRADNMRVEEWFSQINSGQLALPRFQRFEAWNTNQIGDVLENMLRVPPLPIGALLVMELGDSNFFKSRPVTEAPELKNPKLRLLRNRFVVFS